MKRSAVLIILIIYLFVVNKINDIFIRQILRFNEFSIHNCKLFVCVVGGFQIISIVIIVIDNWKYTQCVISPIAKVLDRFFNFNLRLILMPMV